MLPLHDPMRVAEEWAARGAPIVIVNPSAPLGPWDVKPTPTGQMIVDFLRGKMLGSIDTGLNIVHVRDVARGHILAADRGRVGQKYILGNQDLSLIDIFRGLARLTGLRPPRFRVPYRVAWLAALCMEGAARVSGGTPQVPLNAVRMGRKKMFASSAKAERELGYRAISAEDALRRAAAWFTQHGYVRQPVPAAVRRERAPSSPRATSSRLQPTRRASSTFPARRR